MRRSVQALCDSFYRGVVNRPIIMDIERVVAEPSVTMTRFGSTESRHVERVAIDSSFDYNQPRDTEHIAEPSILKVGDIDPDILMYGDNPNIYDLETIDDITSVGRDDDRWMTEKSLELAMK